MKIHGLVVCVNYADLLEKSIARWKAGLASLTIVTDTSDRQTMQLAREHQALAVDTDVFYANGAHFNKGAAQHEAWPWVPKNDWLLLFDADITPPENWVQQIESLNLEAGYLYGCHRYDDQGKRLRDDIHGYGFFQLFHSSDPFAQADPFFDTDWTHAGNGDSSILLRWLDKGKLAPALPLKLHHAGIGPSHNWYGRGNRADFDRMERERMVRGGGWQGLKGEVLPGSDEPALLRR
jgi:hypothetical protein